MLRRDLIDNFLYGIIMGITIVMISYNVFLFRTFREKLFIFFITHSLFTLIFLLSLSGFLYQFIFSNSPILSNRILIVSINGLVCMGSFFGRDFLNLKNTHSGLFRISNWIIGGLLISFAISFGLSYMIATILISVLGIISFFFFTFVSIYLYIFRYEKVISLYFFLINLFITFAGGVVFSSNLGWLDRNFFTTYGFLMAIPFQMIVFSIGISYRVNILKKKNTR